MSRKPNRLYWSKLRCRDEDVYILAVCKDMVKIIWNFGICFVVKWFVGNELGRNFIIIVYLVLV